MVAFALAVCAAPALSEAAIEGRILDASGAAVPGATVEITMKSTGTVLRSTSDGEGRFAFDGAAPGDLSLRVHAEGFADYEGSVRGTGRLRLLTRLQPATLAQQLTVHASRIVGPEAAARGIPGSLGVVDAATLTQSRVLTIDEALRKVPGVYTRAEEGFGLRPNIGIRGLNPTRSSKVLLLEDGVPVSYAPYGDNASYYHPPVDRFESIEVVKGSGQVLYGPSTVGGVINYLTPPPPERSSGSVALTGGNLDYLNAHLRYGTTIRNTGVLLDFMRKQGDGARENTHFGLNDATAKLLHSLTPRQTLAVKANYYGEDSQLTYSGLRRDEFEANPRANPFSNDAVDFNRYGAAVAHTYALAPDAVLNTNLYGQRFQRDWWRQSSNSAQRPNDAADPRCGGMANLHTTCGNEGRLREYTTWGFEPRLRAHMPLFGIRNEFDLGFRGHFERQDRLQQNGDTPTARSGPLVESNLREARAWSGFLQNRLVIGNWALTPGLRLEHVRFKRTNRLLDVRGATDLTQAIPGIGLTYSLAGATTFFAGVHRGFAPPRVEDVINNTTGGTVELEPEMSWNLEAGVRSRLGRTATLEATVFRMDFENQIIPASVAGGTGAALTSAGETLHQGAEISGRADFRNVFGSRHGAWVRGAWTWLPVARFEGRRYSSVTGFTQTLVTGHRVPYAPEHLLTASAGFTHARGWNAMLESVYTGGHFTDDLNSTGASPDGQRGRIPAALVWNASANYPVEAWRTTFFVAVKNVADRLYIVDRARGVLPGMPRMVHFGLRFGF